MAYIARRRRPEFTDSALSGGQTRCGLITFSPLSASYRGLGGSLRLFSNKFAALAAVVLLLIGIPLSAEDGLDDARERREEIAKEAAEKAAELDVLVAEDVEIVAALAELDSYIACLLYTSPSPRDATLSRMPSSA